MARMSTDQVELICGRCLRERDLHRPLTRVNPDTLRPLTSTTVEYHLGQPNKRDNVAEFAEHTRSNLLARRTEDDDGWYLDCHPKRCGMTYKVTDEELRRVVPIAAEEGRPIVAGRYGVGREV